MKLNNTSNVMVVGCKCGHAVSSKPCVYCIIRINITLKQHWVYSMAVLTDRVVLKTFCHFIER